MCYSINTKISYIFSKLHFYPLKSLIFTSVFIKLYFCRHYVETQHCYSMHLGNNRVWDYVGDNFVHRILMNKGDGKLVEGESEKSEVCAYIF